MQHEQSQNVDAIVEHKVRRQLAKKALKDIRRQVDDIEHQVRSEHRALRFILPILLGVALLALLITGWPLLLKLISAGVNAG